MPLYDFHCLDCGERFEALVLKTAASCPSCKSEHLEQQISTFAVSSESTRESNLNGAKRGSLYGYRAKMGRARLAGADLRGAGLRGAALREADMQGAWLDGADLTDADLRGTELARAHYDRFTRWPAGFDPQAHGARLED